MAIPYVGKCFTDVKSFLAYLDGIQFGAWRPRYVVTHHTGSPDLALWRKWQATHKVTDEQWLKNLATYYGSSPSQGGPGDGPWQHGPHFMFTPGSYGVLSLPTARGTHAKSFNANSWCVEMVGDFDSEPFDGRVRDFYVDGLAALHIATGLQLEPYQRAVRGLHLHREDPLTSKTCPGNHVKKVELIRLVQARIDALTGGEHQSTVPFVAAVNPGRHGTITTDNLSVRAGAGATSPTLRTINKGTDVTIAAEAMNGPDKWLQIGDGEWVSAKYVKV